MIRHLRFQYPTKLLDTPNFEIDESGHPYWVTASLTKKIGLFGGTDVQGAIVTDALSGESKYYPIDTVRKDKSLNWIDVVYSDQLLIEQYNYYGKLKKGFWNSIIFQNDVNVASSGNGYIAMDDDVWVYTGITSSKTDTSNFGFILATSAPRRCGITKTAVPLKPLLWSLLRMRCRTLVMQPHSPILLDIEGQPSYFMSLYGDTNTVKGYALVSLEDKTVVGTGLIDTNSDAKALNTAVENYINAMKDKGWIAKTVNAADYVKDEAEIATAGGEQTGGAAEPSAKPSAPTDSKTITGKITDIKSSVNDGNTVYYLQVDGVYYYIRVTDCMQVLLLQKGDTVEITPQGDAKDGFAQAAAVKAKEQTKIPCVPLGIQGI